MTEWASSFGWFLIGSSASVVAMAVISVIGKRWWR